MTNFVRVFLILLSTWVVVGTNAGRAFAQPSEVTAECANGTTYWLRTHTHTLDGELVTGYLLHGPGTTQKVRLIPMGDGYRYSGTGIWLDGVREKATLNIGPAVSIPCQLNFGTRPEQ
jgi:hypothetical protein